MVVRVIWTIYDVFCYPTHTEWCGTWHYVAHLHATLWMYINVVSENQIVSDLPCIQLGIWRRFLVQSLDQMEHQGHHLACGLNNGTEDHIFWIASLVAIIPILCSTYSIPLFTLSRIFVESMACILYFCRVRSSASDIPEFYISMSDMYAFMYQV